MCAHKVQNHHPTTRLNSLTVPPLIRTISFFALVLFYLSTLKAIVSTTRGGIPPHRTQIPPFLPSTRRRPTSGRPRRQAAHPRPSEQPPSRRRQLHTASRSFDRAQPGRPRRRVHLAQPPFPTRPAPIQRLVPFRRRYSAFRPISNRLARIRCQSTAEVVSSRGIFDPERSRLGRVDRSRGGEQGSPCEKLFDPLGTQARGCRGRLVRHEGISIDDRDRGRSFRIYTRVVQSVSNLWLDCVEKERHTRCTIDSSSDPTSCRTRRLAPFTKRALDLVLQTTGEPGVGVNDLLRELIRTNDWVVRLGVRRHVCVWRIHQWVSSLHVEKRACLKRILRTQER